MKNKLLLLFVLTATVYCGAQTIVSPEKFHLRKLKENGKIVDNRTIDEKHTISMVGKTNDGYFEHIYYKTNPYGEKKAYFKNRSLKTKVKLFYMVPIGVQNIFDENGILVSSKNYDEERKFSIDQLIDKMKAEFNVDFLTDSYQKGVEMSVTMDNKQYYDVVLHNYYSEGIHRNIGIDVNNGEILKDKKLVYKKK
jgi:hypothetical protein